MPEVSAYKVAFQGEPGAYSEAAVFEYFRSVKVSAVPCETFEKVFTSVDDGSCKAGFIPIENSLAGSIHQNYDLLMKHSLWVIGEYNLRVSHCLIVQPGTTRSDIRRVISHPQALAQCSNFLAGFGGIKVDAVYDTAGSVKILREQNEPGLAAIASKRAAEIYGMAVLEENVEDNPQNFTRFLAISKQAVYPETDAKSSIVFSVKNMPGALFRALGAFALRDIDLTKIESRPFIGKPWEYLFYIDFIGSIKDPVVARAMAHLEEYATFLRVLGSYSCYRK